MENSLKENWFKVIIILLLSVFIIIYYKNQLKGEGVDVKINTPVSTVSDFLEKRETKKAEPVKSNTDSTCLYFYSKLQSLEVIPPKTKINYSSAELDAIQKTYSGEYDPNINNVFLKQESAKNQDEANLNAIFYEKQELKKNYAFCYEYLAKTYGYILSN